ncbi:MAG: magnesium transporter CorA family protein [Bacteroidota bacterium]
MHTRFTIDHAEGIRENADGEAQLHLFIAPNQAEKTLIQEQFHLDPYDLDSALDAEEVARHETTGNRTFIIWKAPQNAQGQDPFQLGVFSVGIVITDSSMAFIMAEGGVEFSAREFRNASNAPDILLGVLLYTIRHYVGHLRVIKQISTDLEKKITVSMENRYLLQMFALGESLVYYSDAIESNATVLAKLKNVSGRLGFSETHIELLDDIILENQQASRQAHIYSSVLTGLMDARGTIVNNNMNVLLKNLTLINIVFLPLNLIASIGGMSEWSMITKGLDWRISYALFMAAMVLFGWITWIVMTRFIARNDSHSHKKRLVRRRPRRFRSTRLISS